MTVLNVDGAAIFGPGSEWLWTMAQFLALAVTGVAIYRQLRAQAWANGLKIFSRFGDDFQSEQMIRQKLEALIEIAGGNRRMTPALDHIGGWFDGLAEARYHGHMSPKNAAEEFGLVAQLYWALFAPLAPEFRKVDPTIWKTWERWLAEVREYERKAGDVQDLSPERLARWLPETIEYYIARLRIEQETRTGVIPTWPLPGAESTPQSLDPAALAETQARG